MGGAPGTGWMHALNLTGYSGEILVIDPSEMDIFPSGLKITHDRRLVHSIDDIIDACIDTQFEHSRNIVFVWDVRRSDASTSTAEARNAAIASEVAILNEIVSSEWFRINVKFYQLKINQCNISLYDLPKDSKIFVQPHTLSRGVYELRCVGFAPSNVELMNISTETASKIQKETDLIRSDVVSGSVTEYELFLNFFCSLFRECDYVSDDPLVDSEWEIALYTLNWNDSTKLATYFDRLKLRSGVTRFIGSWFVDGLLHDGEYSFYEPCCSHPFLHSSLIHARLSRRKLRACTSSPSPATSS